MNYGKAVIRDVVPEESAMLRKFNRDQIQSLAYTGSLINGTAHNINTPLSAILGRADILRLRSERIMQRMDDQELLQEFTKCRRDIGLIIDNCNRISELVKNAVFRCTAACHNDSRSVNISRVLQEDIDFLMADMEFKHNVEKCIQLDMSIPLIIGLPVHFSNSFMEIITNALEAMQGTAEKKLSVIVCSDSHSITVEISDSGCGMDEQTQQMIMQVLDRPPVSDSGELSGLAYAAGLLQPYAPRYRVDSRPGSTTVAVTFPVQA
jgi:two-component system, NtrC family, sensor kinase